MSKFEDHLWTEFVREHGDAMARVGRPAVRHARRGPRLVVGTGVGLAGSRRCARAGARATSTTPAFAVTRNHDGTVTISIKRSSGIAGANARLHQLGIRATVTQRAAWRLPANGLDSHGRAGSPGVGGERGERPLEDRSEQGPRGLISWYSRRRPRRPPPATAATVGTAATTARRARSTAPARRAQGLEARRLRATGSTVATAATAARRARSGAAARRAQGLQARRLRATGSTDTAATADSRLSGRHMGSRVGPRWNAGAGARRSLSSGAEVRGLASPAADFTGNRCCSRALRSCSRRSRGRDEAGAAAPPNQLRSARHATPQRPDPATNSPRLRELCGRARRLRRLGLKPERVHRSLWAGELAGLAVAMHARKSSVRVPRSDRRAWRRRGATADGHLGRLADRRRSHLRGSGRAVGRTGVRGISAARRRPATEGPRSTITARARVRTVHARARGAELPRPVILRRPGRPTCRYRPAVARLPDRCTRVRRRRQLPDRWLTHTAATG